MFNKQSAFLKQYWQELNLFGSIFDLVWYYMLLFTGLDRQNWDDL